MNMSVQKTAYDGKEYYLREMCGYYCYFHKDFVKEVKNSYTSKILYIVEFPLTECNIVEADGKLAIIPGNYNIFLFPYDDGKIEEVDGAIKIFNKNDSNCAIILSDQDKIKVRWSDDDGVCTTLLHKDGRQEEVPSEELLKYL